MDPDLLAVRTFALYTQYSPPCIIYHVVYVLVLTGILGSLRRRWCLFCRFLSVLITA